MGVHRQGGLGGPVKPVGKGGLGGSVEPVGSFSPFQFHEARYIVKQLICLPPYAILTPTGHTPTLTI